LAQKQAYDTVKMVSELPGIAAQTRERIANARLKEAETLNKPKEGTKLEAETEKIKAEKIKMEFETSPAFIKFSGEVAAAKATGDETAKLTALRQMETDAATIPVNDPILKQQGFSNYGQIMKAAGSKDPGILSASIRAYGEMSSANRAALGTERAAAAAILSNTNDALKRYEGMVDPAALEPSMKSLNDLNIASGKTMPWTPENIAKKQSLEAVRGIATSALTNLAQEHKSVGAEKREAAKAETPAVPGEMKAGEYEPHKTGGQITVKGKNFVIPAGKKFKVTEDGKVLISK
jgi:hypothetical protein